MAKSVDAADLKSVSRRECGFKSRRPHPAAAALALTLAASACGGPSNVVAPSVVVVGPNASLTGRGTPSEVFRRATATGLSRWDSAALVTPSLASRWIVLDDGLTVILRLDDRSWSDASPVRGAEVAERLRTILSHPGDSPTLRALAQAIAKVTAVTPAVLELRMRAQRPDLLVLLAQPEVGLVKGRGGAGPLRPLPKADGWIPLASNTGTDSPVLRLRAESAARALARFAKGEAQAVLGGTSADAPLLQASGAGPAVVDPADGLFALAVRRRRGLLATPEGREAVSLALDRAAILAVFDVAGWPTLPSPASGVSDSAIATARKRVALEGAPVRLSMAQPPGPGGRLLVAVLTRQLARVGIALSTAPTTSTDLVLIDEVAASDEPASTLALIGCGRSTPCGPALLHALDRLGDQPTPEGWRLWSARALEAERADLPVIPLARPLRWSLVTPGLTLTPNARAVHPLTAMLSPASAAAR